MMSWYDKDYYLALAVQEGQITTGARASSEASIYTCRSYQNEHVSILLVYL